MAYSASDFSLMTIKTECEKLESLLSKSFGPLSLKCMITTASGKLAVTSDGSTILNAVFPAHPIGSLVTKAALSHYKICGDGVKSFIFLTTDILRSLLLNKDLNAADCCKHQSKYTSVGRHALVKSFSRLRYMLLQQITRDLKSSPLFDIHDASSSDADDTRRLLLSLIKTSLVGKNSENVNDHLSGILVQLLLASNGNNRTILKERIAYCIRNFSDLVLLHPGASPLTGRFIRGIVIQRDFLREHTIQSDHSITFALLGYSLEEGGKNAAVFEISAEEKFHQIMEWKKRLIERLVTRLKQIGISLVLSTEKIGESFAYACQKHDIAVVHCIPEEDVERLSLACGIQILYTVQDTIVAERSNIVGFAGRWQHIIVGNRQCIWLQNLNNVSKGHFSDEVDKHRTTKTQIFAGHLLLCAMTDGMCRQLSNDLLGALRCLLTNIDNHSLFHTEDLNRLSLQTNEVMAHEVSMNRGEDINLTSLPTGGAFEFWFYEKLSQLSEKCSDPVMVAVFNAVKAAVVRIPLRLQQNSLHPQSAVSEAKLLLKAQNERFVCYVNGRTGDIWSLGGTQGREMESAPGKIILLLGILSLLEQILRIDKALAVSSLPVDKRDDDEHDDDDDD